jgi:surfeit locus 1 family protein
MVFQNTKGVSSVTHTRSDSAAVHLSNHFSISQLPTVQTSTMKVSPSLLRYLRSAAEFQPLVSHKPTFHTAFRTKITPPRTALQRRFQGSFPGANQPADSPGFVSLVDGPVQLVRSNKRHGLGLIVLALIPITAFALGSWQVARLGWKTELIARYEDRLVRDPLPLPPYVDPAVIKDFDYRRVWAKGVLRHDQEILVGPRVHDGENGYSVITPLERKDGSKILISRGWISKDKLEQKDRPLGVPSGEVLIEGLLREPFTKNYFTPDNIPEKNQWYFPDLAQMAERSDSQPVWIEETFGQDMMGTLDRQSKGIPIGRPAEVNLRNNHTQYIFTWYALSLATTIMFWMVVKKPAGGTKARVRQSREW